MRMIFGGGAPVAVAVACRAETSIRGKAVCARWNMPEEEGLHVDPCVHGTALGFGCRDR